jgi:phospholipase/carboxylesterase
MDFKPMHYIYKPSENPEAKTLLLLHGTGGNETDLLQLAESFGKDINVLSLRGNTDENGMTRFFKRLGMGVFDEEDLEFRTHEMVFFLKDLAIKEKFDVTKIIALGYSNGANIAGATLLLYPNFLAATILFRPMMPFKNKKTEINSHNTPVFLSSGKEDPTVNPEETKLYKALLKNNGFDVTEFILYTSHILIQQDLDLAVEWFKKIKIGL